MRALVDMTDIQVEALDALARQAGPSRAALIREAIDAYLARQRRDRVEDGFGLWQDRRTDGLALQTSLRDEW